MSITIQASDSETVQLIENRLLESLRESLPQAQNTQIALAARDETNTVIGGLTASTSYGWLLIKTLWVHKNCRNRGIGRALLRQAEQQAVEASCHAAWLDTSNPQSVCFYQNLGYTEFAKLQNNPDQLPQTHCRWFLQKTL